MGKQLWQAGYGINFGDSLNLPSQPTTSQRPQMSKQPGIIDKRDIADQSGIANRSDAPIPIDAIPAQNGIWDSQETNGIDQVALHGFTMAELVDLGALATTNEERNIQPNNLEGDVHPVFSIDKWETSVPPHFRRKEMFPIGPDADGMHRPGNYAANNLLVWEALLPCLRLASKFVENAHIFPWYNAFLHSDIHQITNVVPKAKNFLTPLRKVHLLRESVTSKPRYVQNIRYRISEIAKLIRLGISNGTADPTGNNPMLQVNYDGVALPPWNDDNGSYRIYIAYQIIEPLLDSEIGPSTRLALQFHVALTLLHEFAHLIVFDIPGARDTKIYLDNERIPEAGFSFEMNTFGGHPVLLLQPGYTLDNDGPLRAGFLLEDWLGTAKALQWTRPLHGTRLDWNDREWREARSIPISFLEELGQEDFWNFFVAKWGAEALKVYPWTEGRLVKKKGQALQTQIYATPKQDPAWLTAAQQASHKSPGQLTPEESISLQIANRRITMEQQIKTLVKARRRLEQQGEQTQNFDSLHPKVYSENDTMNYNLPGNDQPAVASATPGEKKPWEVRADDIATMRALLDEELYQCAREDEYVQDFLARRDVGTAQYLASQTALIEVNRKACKTFRKSMRNALDDTLLDGYENILRNYENMRDQLGRNSRETSAELESEEIPLRSDDQCAALLRRARASRDRGEHKKCCDYCKQIISEKGTARHLRAGAFLLCGLSTAEPEWKIWYLTEATRLYGLMEHFEGDTPSPATMKRRQHAAERLDEAKVEAAATAPTESPLPDPEVAQPTQTATVPKTRLTPEVPLPSTTSTDTTPPNVPKVFACFGIPPTNPATSSVKIDPAPKGMSSADVIRHRRTFKVINQARHNFFRGDYGLAERGFLELLQLQGTSAWQKARCHVFLASIQGRNDRIERANTALKMYRNFLKKWPRDPRCVTAVREAEELLAMVTAEIKWETEAFPGPKFIMSGTLGEEDEDSGFVDGLSGPSNESSGIGDGLSGPGSGPAGMQTIPEDEGENEGEEDDGYEDGDEAETGSPEPENEEKKQTRSMAGIVDKLATILGMKRRRDHDGDGENERGNRGDSRPRLS